MKFRKKPVVIEAVRFTYENHGDITEFCKSFYTVDNPIKSGYMEHDDGTREAYAELLIPTLEGTMKATLGDWIIKGVNGEFYPCKPDIFAMTYDKVDE